VAKRLGCWVAYFTDWSGFRIFDDELAALKFAVECGMKVRYVPWGKDPREEAARG
jgi:hypothetical protein